MQAEQAIRVAILEDHRLVREGLIGTLQDGGLDVVASTGEPGDFLDEVARKQPQVAIVDLTLERVDGSRTMDGVEVLQELGRRHPQVKTLVLSASRSPDVVDRCYQLGAAGYLHKVTISSQGLVAAVQAVQEGKRLVPITFMDQPTAPSVTANRPAGLARLTTRELEVLRHVAAGEDNLKIAAHLQITERTVKAHMASLYRKLGVENRVQLALLGRENGVGATSVN